MEHINESAPSENKVEVIENPPRKTTFEELIQDGLFLEILHSPVLIRCGHTFEKEGIEEQYHKLPHTRCPECNTENPQKQLIDNVICKELIEFYLNLHPEFKQEQHQPTKIQDAKESKCDAVTTKQNSSPKTKEDKNPEIPKKEKTFEDFLTCPLTKKIFFNPITLPCTHTFEQRMLMDMLKNDCVNCPNCKRKTHKSNFIYNFLLKRIIDYRTNEKPELRDQQYFPMRNCLKILYSKSKFANKVSELSEILIKQPWGLGTVISSDDLVEEKSLILEGFPLLSYFTNKTENFEILKKIVDVHPLIIGKEFLNSFISAGKLKNVPIIAQFAVAQFTHPFILKLFTINPKLMELDTYNLMVPNYGANSIYMFTRTISGLKILNDILNTKPAQLTQDGWLALTELNSLRPGLNAFISILCVDSQNHKAEAIKTFKLVTKQYPNLINFESFNYSVTDEINKGWNICNSMASEAWGRKFLKKILKEQPHLITLEALTIKCRMNDKTENTETDLSSDQESSVALPNIGSIPEQKKYMYTIPINSLDMSKYNVSLSFKNKNTNKSVKTDLDLSQLLKPQKIVQYNALVWLLEDNNGKEILKDLANSRPDLLISAIKITIADKVLTITEDEKKFLSSLLVIANKNKIAVNETVPAKTQPQNPAVISPSPVQTRTSLSSSVTTKDSKTTVITKEIEREISELIKAIDRRNKDEVLRRVFSSSNPIELLTVSYDEVRPAIGRMLNDFYWELNESISKEIFIRLDPNIATKVLEFLNDEVIEYLAYSDRNVERMKSCKKDLQALVDVNKAKIVNGSKPDISSASAFSFTEGSSSTHFSRTSTPAKKNNKDADSTPSAQDGTDRATSSSSSATVTTTIGIIS